MPRAERLADDDPVVELQHPVRDREVAIVVADHDHRLAARAQLRQKLFVEHRLERGVLVGRPFVEQVERPVLQIRDDEREPFALPGRQRARGERAVDDLHLVIERELRDERVRARVGLRARRVVRIDDAEQRVEQMEIVEHRREALAVRGALGKADRLAVELDDAALGLVQAREHLRERRLAAAVAADEEHELARLERQVDRPDAEHPLVALVEIRMRDAAQRERVERLVRRVFVRRRRGAQRAELRHQLLDALERHARRVQRRHVVEQAVERQQHEQEHDDVAGRRGPVAAHAERGPERRDAQEHVEQEHDPADADRIRAERAAAVVAHLGDRRAELAVDELARTRLMQLELLRAGKERAEIAEQLVLRAARVLEPGDRALVARVIAERADEDRGDREQAHGPRQPRQIAEAAEHDRAVHHEIGQREEQHRHVGRVVGQHRLHGRRADPLDVLQLGRRDAPRDVLAQLRHRVLRQPREQHAGDDPGDERDHRAQAEAPRERRVGGLRLGERAA
ncbi:csw domain protein [Burkholderia pseudomallei MSHR2990]|nr:csw domain protein [Burkholderia pseudomallei MSHR2990]